MAVSFFVLPPEVRNIVYEILFVSPEPEHVVHPVPNKGSRRDKYFGLPNAKQAISLFRTCQVLHEEATSVFYGKNVFLFTHGAMRARLSGSVGACNHRSNFAAMPSFLYNIGYHNRVRMRHFGLQLTTRAMNRLIIEYTVFPSIAAGGAANSVLAALQMLSEGHNLTTVRLVFSSKDEEGTSAAWNMLKDFNDSCQDMREYLGRIQGLRELKITTHPETDYQSLSSPLASEILEMLQTLKTRMEAPRPEQTSQAPLALTSDGRQSKARSFGFTKPPILAAEQVEGGRSGQQMRQDSDLQVDTLTAVKREGKKGRKGAQSGSNVLGGKKLKKTKGKLASGMKEGARKG